MPVYSLKQSEELIFDILKNHIQLQYLTPYISMFSWKNTFNKTCSILRALHSTSYNQITFYTSAFLKKSPYFETLRHLYPILKWMSLCLCLLQIIACSWHPPWVARDSSSVWSLITHMGGLHGAPCTFLESGPGNRFRIFMYYSIFNTPWQKETILSTFIMLESKLISINFTPEIYRLS